MSYTDGVKYSMTIIRLGAVPTSSYITCVPEPSKVLSMPKAVINGKSLYVAFVSVVKGCSQ